MDEKFMARVRKDPSTGCWLWTGEVNAKGYGRTWVNGKREKAHRVAWRETNGPIPEGMVLCHRCDRPSCVNPDHLFLGDMRVNAIDMVRKGRAPAAKLSRSRAEEIRTRVQAGESMRSIAREVGVDPKTIRLLVRGATWKWEDEAA